jgi:hypothetical protein
MAKGKLSIEMKRFVVTELAMWETPTNVQRSLRENYGVEITLQSIQEYDGDRAHCPKKWKALFDEVRAKFVEDYSSIPIANKGFRLRELQKIVDVQRRRPDAQRNPADIRATLELAAKEVGNVFTNRQEHTGKGGKPLIPEGPNVVVYLPDNGRPDVT